MSRKLVPFSVLLAAAISSIASSPPRWTAYGDARESFKVDRGDALELDILLEASSAALPDVEGGFAPQGGPSEGGLSSTLTVELDIRSRGSLLSPIGETTLVAELWMDTEEGDWLVDDFELDVTAGKKFTEVLTADGVFSTCEARSACERELYLVIEQSGDTKLKVKVDARARIHAPMDGPAPDEAIIDVELLER